MFVCHFGTVPRWHPINFNESCSLGCIIIICALVDRHNLLCCDLCVLYITCIYLLCIISFFVFLVWLLFACILISCFFFCLGTWITFIFSRLLYLHLHMIHHIWVWQLWQLVMVTGWVEDLQPWTWKITSRQSIIWGLLHFCGTKWLGFW